jgi:hypothetical protein
MWYSTASQDGISDGNGEPGRDEEVHIFCPHQVYHGLGLSAPQVTKIFQKKKNSVTYSFRQSFSLCGLQVLLFENQCESARGHGSLC